MSRHTHRVEQHRAPAPGIEVMTLVSNHHFPRHSHDQFAIGVIDLGAQRSWSGIGTVYASAGDVITANPGEMHDGIPIAGNTRRWRMIYFDRSIVYRELEHDINGAIEIARPVVRDPVLEGIFTRLFKSLTVLRVDSFATEELLLSCLVHLFAKHGTSRASSTGPSPSISKAVRYLNSSVERSTSLAELAALTGLSRFQILRAFAREFGITPHAYLMQRRVLLARRLLTDGKMPADAAIQAGFADQSHMTRAFVRQLGITPGRYRAAVT